MRQAAMRMTLAAVAGVLAMGGEAAAQGGPVELCASAELACGEALELALPDRAELGTQVLLSFRARIQARYQTGSAPALQVAVNGLPTSIERLRNKPAHYLFSGDRRVDWFSPAEAAWVLPYYAWERTDVAEGLVHAFVLDITDLLRPAGNGLSFLSVYGTDPAATVQLADVRLLATDDFRRAPSLAEPQVMTESAGLGQFRRRALGYHAGAEARLNTQIAYRPHAGIVAPRASYAQDYDLRMDATGGIALAVGGDRYETRSHLRAGGGPWLSIGGGDAAGWAEYAAEDMNVRARTAELELSRGVLRHDSCVEVRDTLTNRTGADLPVVVVHALDVGPVPGIREFRLSGQLQHRFWASTSPIEGRRTAATPTAYVERDGSAIGLVMEDDALRNQGSFLVWDSTVAIGNDLFYLAPGASYTFVWKLFPLAEPGYYGLVNALRHDWDLFGYIPGLFGFVHPWSEERMYEDVRLEGPEQKAAWLADTGIDVAATGAMIPFADGKPGMLYGNEEIDDLRTGLQPFVDWREAVRAHGAQVRCIPYMDVHLVRLVGERTLADLEARLPGALIRDAWGDPVAYRTGWLYNVLPTLDNAAGRHLMDALRLYVDELGFDGIYLDEWDHSRARISFSHDDGMSALLDENGRIVRKVGLVPLLARDFQVAFVGELVARAATIFANQFDGTLATAQLPVVHFAEPYGSYDSYLLAAAQCCRTPLALNVKATQGIWQDTKEYLKRGLLLCYYWKYFHGDHVLKRCFPITVREVHPGYVIGDDRIVTCASGTFTLGRDVPLTAYVYAGPDGTLQTTVPANATVDGHRAVALSLTDDEIAVIIEEGAP